MMSIGENGEITRRRVPRTRFHGADVDRRSVDRILESYGRYRLLTFDRDAATRTVTVEIAHEALLSEWTRLAHWIDEVRDDLILHRRLESGAVEWMDTARDPQYLFRGASVARQAGGRSRGSSEVGPRSAA